MLMYYYSDDGHSSKETDAESGGSSSTTTLSLEHSHEVTKLLQGPVGELVSGCKNQGAIPKQRTGLYSAYVWLKKMCLIPSGDRYFSYCQVQQVWIFVCMPL
jgi:hypothetical protein